MWSQVRSLDRAVSCSRESHSFHNTHPHTRVQKHFLLSLLAHTEIFNRNMHPHTHANIGRQTRSHETACCTPTAAQRHNLKFLTNTLKPEHTLSGLLAIPSRKKWVKIDSDKLALKRTLQHYKQAVTKQLLICTTLLFHIHTSMFTLGQTYRVPHIWANICCHSC